jgi:hypothetical protein
VLNTGATLDGRALAQTAVTLDANAVTISTSVAPTSIAPTITLQPQSPVATAGATVTFSVTATGTTPLGYQWRKDGTAITGATSASYSIASVAPGDAGSYVVVVSNVAGSVTSQAATVTLNVPLTITTVPANSAIGVPVSQTLAATFSAAMNPSTITGSTFTLTGPGATPVTGTVAYDVISHIATFAPGSALAANTIYTATITTGAKDLAGNALASDSVWSFTTATTTVDLAPVILVSAAVDTGPYTNASGHSVNLATKTITVPMSGSMQFYRIMSATALTIASITISGGNAVIIYN